MDKVIVDFICMGMFDTRVRLIFQKGCVAKVKMNWIWIFLITFNIFSTLNEFIFPEKSQKSLQEFKNQIGQFFHHSWECPIWLLTQLLQPELGLGPGVDNFIRFMSNRFNTADSFIRNNPHFGPNTRFKPTVLVNCPSWPFEWIVRMDRSWWTELKVTK